MIKQHAKYLIPVGFKGKDNTSLSDEAAPWWKKILRKGLRMVGDERVEAVFYSAKYATVHELQTIAQAFEPNFAKDAINTEKNQSYYLSITTKGPTAQALDQIRDKLPLREIIAEHKAYLLAPPQLDEMKTYRSMFPGNKQERQAFAQHFHNKERNHLKTIIAKYQGTDQKV